MTCSQHQHCLGYGARVETSVLRLQWGVLLQVRLVERMGPVGTGSTCASPTCRARSEGRRVSGSCYSAICLSSFKDKVKLAPAPDDEAMAEDKAAQTSAAWGKGRLLRQQQREKRNVHDDKISVTAEQAAGVRLRFTKMDDSLLKPTLYTIAFSTDTDDWLVERTYADLQALHRLFVEELGGKDGFPDDVFLGAVKRQVRLEAWLRDAVKDIPFLRRSSQHMAVGLLGVWLQTPEQAEGTATAAVRRTHSVALEQEGGDAPVRVTVDDSEAQRERRLQQVAECNLQLGSDIASTLQPRLANVIARVEMLAVCFPDRADAHPHQYTSSSDA